MHSCTHTQESSWQYWPAAVRELVGFGEFTVDLISEEALEGFTIRTLSLLHTKASRANLHGVATISISFHLD